MRALILIINLYQLGFNNAIEVPFCHVEVMAYRQAGGQVVSFHSGRAYIPSKLRTDGSAQDARRCFYADRMV